MTFGSKHDQDEAEPIETRRSQETNQIEEVAQTNIQAALACIIDQEKKDEERANAPV